MGFFFFFFIFLIKDKKFSIGLGLPNFLFTRVCKFLLYGVKKKNVIYNFFFLVYNTPTKAWDNAYVVGSGPYTWSGCERGKRKRWLKDLILGQCQRHDYLGKEVRYAPDMVLKHLQKGR